jgi:thymidylate kinase
MILSTPKEYLPREDSKEAREKIWKFYILRLKEIEKLLDDHPESIIILDRFFFSELTYGKVMR